MRFPRAPALVACAVLLVPPAVYGNSGRAASSELPKGYLGFAYRMHLVDNTGADVLATLVFAAVLQCWGSGCMLITTTLNDCHDQGLGPASIIQFRHASTDDGGLEVLKAEQEKDHGALVVKEHWGSAEVTYNIGYSRSVLSLTLASLSGVAVDAKSSDRVYTWTLQPFQGRYVRWTPDCPFLLEGVPKQ
jgi:hypothetical protein